MFNIRTHAECGKTPGSWMLLYNAEVFSGLHQLIKLRSRTCANIHISHSSLEFDYYWSLHSLLKCLQACLL